MEQVGSAFDIPEFHLIARQFHARRDDSLQSQFVATRKAMAEQASSVADGILHQGFGVVQKLKPADTASKSDPTMMDRLTEAVSSGLLIQESTM
ncbi:hypothetical protein GN244_ATG10457 [Phytophthora infestans]|uniref:Uncharacterized protein n=1 Tax=Phytophthora infestans TaxID=4787 RepID=A0A833WJ39_PHYIN|nr:hypothetical protein GN244_ATG10457 [Phytophthora infestans]